MNKTYYVAVSLEMTANGPEFHMVHSDDPADFREKYSALPGEVFVRHNKSIHIVEGEAATAAASNVNKELMLDKVADAIAEVKKHRGSYMSSKEAEDIFKHLRVIREEASK